MTTTYLLDTNILLYPFDHRDPDKQSRAVELLAVVGSGSRGALPAQALAEFSAVAMRKLRPALEAREVYAQVENFEQTFPVLPLSAAVVLEALRGVATHGLSYYDAQVWAIARLHQIPILLSEDFSTGVTLEGVTFLNPLLASFSLDDLA